MQLKFSFVIPVYNRPDEIDELLESLTKQTYTNAFEIVIVEDGSTIPAKDVIKNYNGTLEISYYYKPNSGPGASRNYGMERAKGNYFIILDSDCIIPENYLEHVHNSLNEEYVDCFGGPDNAHHSFTDLQKAINYAMTSFLTTGGIRGGKKAVEKFQPRSFNMGISKAAFEKTQGFGRIHPGEDPDLTIRIWNAGYTTKLIPEAFVYHKRRISWKKFYTQVNKFGKVRPILNKWHPQTEKITYWFPSLFCIGFVTAIAIAIMLKNYWFLLGYALYFVVIFLDALWKTKNIKIALSAMLAVCIQFYGYGIGFLKSTLFIKVFGVKPEDKFPELFFKK